MDNINDLISTLQFYGWTLTARKLKSKIRVFTHPHPAFRAQAITLTSGGWMHFIGEFKPTAEGQTVGALREHLELLDRHAAASVLPDDDDISPAGRP